jgi:hypothetical protein
MARGPGRSRGAAGSRDWWVGRCRTGGLGVAVGPIERPLAGLLGVPQTCACLPYPLWTGLGPERRPTFEDGQRPIAGVQLVAELVTDVRGDLLVASVDPRLTISRSRSGIATPHSSRETPTQSPRHLLLPATEHSEGVEGEAPAANLAPQRIHTTPISSPATEHGTTHLLPRDRAQRGSVGGGGVAEEATPEGGCPTCATRPATTPALRPSTVPVR